MRPICAAADVRVGTGSAACSLPNSPAHPWRSMARLSTRLPAPLRFIRGISDEHGLGQGVVAIMREREQHAPGPLGQGPAAAGEHHHRRLSPLAPHLELLPLDPHAKPRAQRLERGLLRREARGEMGNGIAAAPAVGDLVFGEYAAKKAIVPALHHPPEPPDLGQVHADALDLAHAPMAFLMMPASSRAMPSMRAWSSPSIMTRASSSVPE